MGVNPLKYWSPPASPPPWWLCPADAHLQRLRHDRLIFRGTIILGIEHRVFMARIAEYVDYRPFSGLIKACFFGCILSVVAASRATPRAAGPGGGRPSPSRW